MRRPEDLKTTPSNEDFARLMTLAGAYIAAAIDRYKQHTRLQHTASLDDRPLPKRTCASDSPHIPPKPAGKAAHTSTLQAHTSPRARGVSRDVPSMRSRRERARPRPSQLLTRSRPQRWSPKTRHHRRRAEDFSYHADRMLCVRRPAQTNHVLFRVFPPCKFPDCHGDGSAQHAAVGTHALLACSGGPRLE